MRISRAALASLLLSCATIVACSSPAAEDPAIEAPEAEKPATEVEDSEPEPLACEQVMSAAAFARARGSRPDEEAVNRIAIAGGTISWNGQTVSPVTLRQYLDLVATMTPTPVLTVDVAPDAVPQTVALARVAIDQSQHCDSRAAFGPAG